MRIKSVTGLLTPKRILKQNERWRLFGFSMLAVQLVMLATLSLTAEALQLREYYERYYTQYIVSFFSVFLLALMFQSSIRSIIRDKATTVFMLMIVVLSINTFADGLSWIVNLRAGLHVLNYILVFITFFCNLLLSYMFWIFVVEWLKLPNSPTVRFSKRLVEIAWLVGLVNLLANFCFGHLYSVTENGVYLVGDFYGLALISPAVIFVVAAIHIFKQDMRFGEKIVLLSYPFFPYLMSIGDDADGEPSYMCTYCLCSLFFIFCNLYIRRERELVEKQAELAESKINSMMLQINPHFIYNTLGSVASLCSTDPEEAESLLFKFSKYLRNNFGELSQKSLIPFTKEADHVMSYLEIERVRFPDIDIKYDFKVTAFEIPSLSIQPLVENAIKHGIMGREDGGTIVISTFEDDRAYHVLVSDDGVGFDGAMPLDGRNHIGVANVNNRLRLLCGGELKLTSEVGVGTTSEIIIPKERKA